MPADPPDGGSSSGGTDVLVRIATWFGGVLTDIVRTFADAEAGKAALADYGWTAAAPALPQSLIDRLDQELQAGQDPKAQAVETFAEVLVALAALGEAMQAVAGDNDTPAAELTSVGEIIADMLDLTIALRLRREHPAVWAILRMLNLLNDDGFALANLSDLVGDTQKYLTGLVKGPGYAQAFQDYSTVTLGVLGTAAAFLPSRGEHGHGKESLRSETIYGWTPASPGDHPNLMQVLGRTLTWRLDWQSVDSHGSGLETTADVTMALVPAEHNLGDWGVFLRLAGAATISIPLGGKSGWQLTISSTVPGTIEALFAANGFLRGVGEGYKAVVALERPDDLQGSWVVGPATGSHVELQHARLAGTVSYDNASSLLDVNAHADHFIVDIKLGGDSFLGAVLPPSLRIDSALGLGVDTRRGVYFTGGVALIVDLPINRSFGGEVLKVVLQALHLRIGLATDTKSAAFELGLTMDASVQIAGGVFTATVAGVGLAFAIKQAPAGGDGSTAHSHWQPELKAIPPNGVGLAIKAGAVSGGGFISFDPDRGEYSGALQLKIALAAFNIDVVALGMLDTKIPDHPGDWALLLILAVTFSPGIQVGFGISISGFGGALGINHSLDSDAIAKGLRTKALDAILFPPDPVAQAPHIFAVWRQTLPLSDGHTIFGPMIRLAWGGTVFTAEVAVLFELDPGLVQIVLLGSLRIAAPSPDTPGIYFRADILGRLRFNPLDFMLEADIVEGKLGTFTITGGLVIVARGEPDPAYLLSLGGFNPHFTPPRNVPVVDRIRVDISGTDNPRLRLETYFALTSQSVQLGARVELHAAAGPLALDGWLAFDALIQWLPHFRLSVEISAGLSLSYNGSPILEIAIDVLLEGPRQWHIHGYAELHLLFFTLSLPFDHVWGDPAEPSPPSAQPQALVSTAMTRPDAWSASMQTGEPNILVLRPLTGTDVPAHPLAAVSCRQNVLPLGLAITHVGNQPLAAPTTIDIVALQLAGVAANDVSPVVELFAAGQYLNLTDDQSLSRPSFEPMRAGLTAGRAASDTGNAAVVATTYKTLAVDGASSTQQPHRWLLDPAHAQALLRPSAPPTARPLPTAVSLASDTLRSTAVGAPQTAALAAQGARGAPLYDQIAIAGGGK